jgi:hypothetical protein
VPLIGSVTATVKQVLLDSAGKAMREHSGVGGLSFVLLVPLSNLLLRHPPWLSLWHLEGDLRRLLRFLSCGMNLGWVCLGGLCCVDGVLLAAFGGGRGGWVFGVGGSLGYSFWFLLLAIVSLLWVCDSTSLV